MKKFTWQDLGALILWLLPIAYLAYIFPTLPAKVPVHWGLNGKADGYGNGNSLIFLEIVLSGTALGTYLLIKFLPKIDPKKAAKTGEAMFAKLSAGLVIFLTAINLVILYATVHGSFDLEKFMFPLISLLFAFLGNVMYNIKPNYFVGIRTPWTLENEDNWRATHRLAAKVWFIGGVLLTILTLLLKAEVATIAFLVGTLVIAFIPMIYSYIYFKKHPAKT